MRNKSKVLVLAIGVSISPHHNCTNTLRLDMRLSVERLSGPCAGDRDERAPALEPRPPETGRAYPPHGAYPRILTGTEVYACFRTHDGRFAICVDNVAVCRPLW